MNNSWKYYNYALLPNCEPHEIVDIPEKIWKIEKRCLLARWTSEFDSCVETGWWYVIKDTPFDIGSLKAKRRYEINKGNKNFEVKRIDALENVEELYEVHNIAVSQWPEYYRPQGTLETFRSEIIKWDGLVTYAGYDMKTKKICAYSMLTEFSGHLEFNVLRTDSAYERMGINAAMVCKIVEDYNNRLGTGYYINDGERAIRHETAFQDYLEKYFGFRKAYCRLNIKYRFPIGVAVNLLYPFRRCLVGKTRIGNLICGVLRMEEIRRKQKEVFGS